MRAAPLRPYGGRDLYGRQSALTRVADLGHGGYEFQMLLGVREARASELVAEGHRLRVYVPFGQRWYEYSLRRLQENPRIARYVAKDVVRVSCPAVPRMAP